MRGESEPAAQADEKSCESGSYDSYLDGEGACIPEATIVEPAWGLTEESSGCPGSR